jgi:hypothetical protein
MERRRGQLAGPPELKPLDVDGVRTVAIITVLWAVAFVVLAFFRSQLDEDGRGWWLWTCLAGVGLGLLGLEYCRKRRDAIARAELDAEADAGFDDAGDWADGELAALAAEADQPDAGFDQPTQNYSPDDQTPPAAPLPFDTPPPPGRQGPLGQPVPPHAPPSPPGGHDTDQHTRPYSPAGRPPPGYVTGDFPAVTGDFPPVSGEFPRVTGEFPLVTGESAQGEPPAPHPPSREPYPPSEAPPRHQARPEQRPLAAPEPRPEPPRQRDWPEPRPPRMPPANPAYPEAATPAGYSPAPDHTRRHPRDEELARRYREEQARAAAGGYEPPSYPQFLEEAAHQREAGFPRAGRHDTPAEDPSWIDRPPVAERPSQPAPPTPPRPAPALDSEFFSDEPASEPNHGADFLLDDDEPDGGYRGRRARQD